MATIELRILGGFRLGDEAGREVTVASRKGQILLSLLALSSGEWVYRERVVGLLWGDRGDAQARGSLRQELMNLRKVLSNDQQQLIEIDGERLRLDLSGVEVDVCRFETLIRSEEGLDLERALEMYRGPFLGDITVKDPACSEWLYQERDRLRGLYVAGLDRLLARRLAEGALDRASAVGEAILAHDPLREDIHRQLMELYARQGRHTHALKQFQICQATLAKELDIQPEPATIRLFEQIRDNRAIWSEAALDRGKRSRGLGPIEAPSHETTAEANLQQAGRNDADATLEAAQLYQMGRSFFLRNIWGKRALEAARQLFVLALEADPNYARAYAGLADCDCYRLLLGVKGVSMVDVAANTQNALDLEPDLPEALTAKGLSLYVVGDHSGAIPYFERAIALAPDLFEARYFSARNYRTLGRHDAAALNFEQAAALNKNDYRALGLLADEYRSLGRLGDSLAASRACLERVSVEVATQPDDWHALSFGSIILAELGEWGRAEEWAERARRVNPDDPIVNYNLACAYAQLGRSDVAVERLRATYASPDINRRAFFEWMREDSALASLRAHPDFTTLWNEIARTLTPAEAMVTTDLVSVGAMDRVPLAVLPFAYLGADPARDYMAEGITEDIITELSRLPGLSVVSRGAVARYRGVEVQIQDVARALSVRFVVEGSLRATDEKVSVNVKLVDGFTGACVWAERYQAGVGDTLEAQHQMSRAITVALIAKLLPGAPPIPSESRTTNAEAYRQFLVGRSYLLMRGGGIAGLQIARRSYERAVELDPNFAQAHAGIAMADSLRLWRGDQTVSLDEIFARADRALELEPTLPEANVARGLAYYMVGRHSEADQLLSAAVRLGPSLFEAHHFAGRNKWLLDKCEEAAAHFERAAELLPDHYRAPGLAVAVYQRLGWQEKMQYAASRCLDRCKAEISVHPNNVDAVAFAAAVLADSGQFDEARKWLARAESLHPSDAVSIYNIAATHAALGEVEAALKHLRGFFALTPAVRRNHLDWLQRDKVFEAVRRHPGFATLIEDGEAKTLQAPPASARRPAIAVLPFTNLNEAAEQQYLADALVEEIVAALSRVRSFFVVARSSTIRYRERTNDPAILASELGVRYLLEGSVRVVGSRIRVAVHLMDAGSGTSIWAEHFDRDKENIFDLQDEITEQAVGAIEPTIRKAEIELSRRKRPESLEAYDLVMRALPLMLEMTSGASQEALRLASEAARLDPGYARAHAMAAWCHAWMVAHEWAEDRAAARSDGMKFAHTALRLDGDDPTVLTMVSAADTLLMGDLESAGAHVAKALAIDPNSAWGWVRSGYVQIYLGNVDAALEHFQRAERLSPYDVLSFNLYVGRSLAHFTAARYREAAEWAGMALAERPGLPGALRMMTAAQAMLGRMEEARSTVGALLVECPGSTIKSALDSLPIRRPDARERLVGALKSAGLPEA